MNALWLKFTLQSEACFSRGDGTPGEVDIEVQHDQHGLPYLHGRTLKGLLAAEAAQLCHALSRALPSDQAMRWQKTAMILFGDRGGLLGEGGKLHVGSAQLPTGLRAALANELDSQGPTINPHEVLSSLTVIRRQTAIDEETGAPQRNTLRAVRVILRETPFESTLNSLSDPFTDDELAFLAACAKAFRRAGSNKTRGYGRLTATLWDDQADQTDRFFKTFEEALQ